MSSRVDARRPIIGVLLSLGVVYAALSFSVGDALTRTTTPRAPFTHLPADYGLQAEDVHFPSRGDRYQIDGWLLTPAAGALCRPPVVFVHGWRQDRQSEVHERVLEISAHLVQRGYPVLQFDLRGWGRSEGDRFSLGPRETADVIGAIDLLDQRGLAGAGVYLLGYSMGGATGLLAAPGDTRVRAVVEDSAYANLWPIVAQEVPARSGLPGFFTPGTVLAASVLTGANLFAVQPMTAAGLLGAEQVPLLVIHGEADTFVPPAHGRRIAAAYGQRAETWFVPGADHVAAYIVDPRTYLARLDAFFARADAAVTGRLDRNRSPQSGCPA